MLFRSNGGTTECTEDTEKALVARRSGAQLSLESRLQPERRRGKSGFPPEGGAPNATGDRGLHREVTSDPTKLTAVGGPRSSHDKHSSRGESLIQSEPISGLELLMTGVLTGWWRIPTFNRIGRDIALLRTHPDNNRKLECR